MREIERIDDRKDGEQRDAGCRHDARRCGFARTRPQDRARGAECGVEERQDRRVVMAVEATAEDRRKGQERRDEDERRSIERRSSRGIARAAISVPIGTISSSAALSEPIRSPA